MKPKLELLDAELIQRILGEAFQLLMEPGVKVGAPQALELLAAGAQVADGVAHIPERLARKALESVPHEFFLYDRAGRRFTMATTTCILIPARPA